MASFQAKIGLKRPRKRKNKNYRFVPFPTRCVIENSNKIVKKFKKLKIPLWLPFKPKLVGKGREREKIKTVIPFRSVPTLRVIGNSKKIAKKFKNTIMASF